MAGHNRSFSSILSISLVVSVLLFLFASPIQAVQPGEGVTALTSKNFDAEVLSTDAVVMVEFYAPWCGHCVRLAPEWKKAADSLNGIVKVVAVNCDDEKEIAQRFGIKGFPSIKVFPAGRENKKKPEDYNGPRAAKDIVNFALGKLPSHVQSVASESQLDKFLTQQDPQLPHVILVTNKNKTPPLFKSLALDFKKKAAFAEIRINEKDASASAPLLERLSLSAESLPKVIAFANAETQSMYDGKMDKKGLTQFISQFAGSSSSTEKKADKDAKKQEKKEKKSTNKAESEKPEEKETPQAQPEEEKTEISSFASTPTLDELTPKTWEPLCASKNADKMCVVAFIKSIESENVEDRSTVIDAAQKTVLESLAQRYALDRTRFVWVDVNRYPVFAEEFGVSLSANADRFPTLMILNGKKARFALQHFRTAEEIVGSPLFSLDTAAMFVDKLASGELKWTKLKELPSFTDASATKSCGSEESTGDEGLCTSPH